MGATEQRMQARQEGHNGNPAIMLPPDHHGGSVRILRPGTQELIWESHTLAAGEPVVLVNVWDGLFVGSGQGWAVLDAGEWQIVWAGADGEMVDLGRLNIEPRVVFESDFAQVPALYLNDGKPWLGSGEWDTDENGIRAHNDRVFLFAEGISHGVYRVVFAAEKEPAQGRCWGLIIRHYNWTAHLRLMCQQGKGQWSICLERVSADLKNCCLAGHVFSGDVPAELDLQWHINGTQHRVLLDGVELLVGREGAMSSVDIVGLFADVGSVTCAHARMESTQRIPQYSIKRPVYSAEIRPGKIHSLCLRKSKAPQQNLFWEGGIQLGHMGGSEIKTTQGSQLRLIEDGPVASVFRWQGPMPKFVEQSDDVRGQARGQATFYQEHIVIADDALVWARRSVGLDFDLLGRLMCGPARMALGQSDQLQDWTLPVDGGRNFIPAPADGPAFPVALTFPFDLQGQKWWLQGVVNLRYPDADEVSTSRFAWQCIRGLTASHDLRCAPTIPGQEYAYSIVISFVRGEDQKQIEADLLNLRDDWMNPMDVKAIKGELVKYETVQEHPKEATGFNGCFDQVYGQYVTIAKGDEIELWLDPQDIRRRRTIVAIRNWPRGVAPICSLDGQVLANPQNVMIQECRESRLLVMIDREIDKPLVLKVIGQ